MMNCTPVQVWLVSSDTINSTEGPGNTSVNTTNITVAKWHQLPVPELCNFYENCKNLYPVPVWILLYTVGGLTFLANVISLVVLSRLHASMTPVLRLALMNLSLTDAIGSVSFIYHVRRSFDGVPGTGLECKIRYIFYVTMNVVTLSSLVYMSVERLLAVMAPFLHVRVDGRRVTAVALACIWITSSVTIGSGMHRLDSKNLDICLYHVLVPRTTHLSNASLALMSIFFIVFANFGLYAQARKEIKLIGRTLVAPVGNPQQPSRQQEINSRNRKLAQMTDKATSTTIAVVVPFAIFNTPLYILMLIFYLNPEFMMTCKSVSILTGLSSFLVINSLCNPLIYAWKLRTVRAELIKLMPCLRRRQLRTQNSIETRISVVQISSSTTPMARNKVAPSP